MSNLFPCDGSVYSFRTVPYSEFAPRVTGRYGALKVLGSDGRRVIVGILDSVWSTPPSLLNIRDCAMLRQHRFSHTARPAVWCVNAEYWNPSDLAEMTLLGAISLSTEDLQFASDNLQFLPGSVFAALSYANYAAEGEWRWANDREALVAEQEKIRAEELAKRAAQEERQRNRLRHLTWKQLFEETPFERWSSSPPFPPEEFTRLARIVVHDTCRALCALGGKPRKPDVRRLLRACVEWFNEADAQAGGVIETEEREDICAVLEEMAYVARQKSLVEEIDNWRDW